MSDLAGLRVLVTRPAAQAEPLCAAIEAAGGVALRLPLQAIMPMDDADSTRAEVDAARDADAWLFTSVNAVAQAVALGIDFGMPLPSAGEGQTSFVMPANAGIHLSDKGESMVLYAANRSRPEHVLDSRFRGNDEFCEGSASGKGGAPSDPCVTRFFPDLAATGAATAAALHAAGAGAVLTSTTRDGAVGLLALPRFADVRGQRLAVIGGERPLPDLVDGLRSRGAEVESIAVYRRIAVAQDPATVAKAIGSSEVILLANGEALRALLDLTPAATLPVLLARPLALPSARVVELARRAGFTSDLRVPERVADADWLELLHRGLPHWRAHAPRTAPRPTADDQPD